MKFAKTRHTGATVKRSQPKETYAELKERCNAAQKLLEELMKDMEISVDGKHVHFPSEDDIKKEFAAPAAPPSPKSGYESSIDGNITDNESIEAPDSLEPLFHPPQEQIQQAHLHQ